METFTTTTNNATRTFTTQDTFTFLRGAETYKQENTYTKFNNDNIKYENQTFNRQYNESTKTCMLGKRVKTTQFGENSETEICEEGDDDGEGKKYIFKRTKRDMQAFTTFDTHAYDKSDNKTDETTFIEGATDYGFGAFIGEQTTHTTNDNETSTDASINSTPNMFTEYNTNNAATNCENNAFFP